MESESKLSARLRAKAWYQANKDRKRAYDAKRRVTHRERFRDAYRRFYAKHKNRLKSLKKPRPASPRKPRAIQTEAEKALTYRAWYLKNKDRVVARAAAWKAVNPEKSAAAKRAYKKTDKGRVSELKYKRGRRAAHRKARPVWRNEAAMDAIYAQAALNGLHVDHIVPLRHRLVCGLHVETNLRLAAPLENLKKGNRWWPDMP